MKMVGPPSRRWYITGYVLLAAAGLAALLWPSPSVVAAGGRIWAGVWATLLIVGGVSCAYGAIRRLHRWEYAGLAPLIAVWVVYSIASFTLAFTGVIDRLASGCSLMAVACFVAARWREVAAIRKAAREIADNGR